MKRLLCGLTLGLLLCLGASRGAVAQTVVFPTPLPFFMPPHTGGDRDFVGHGPNVYTYVQLMVWAQRYIWAYVWMQAEETSWDWTRASGGQYYLVYTHDKPIERLLSPTFGDHFYTDTNHDRDWFSFPPSAPFEFLVFVGDTYGDEAGSRTGVQVFLHPITILEAP